MRGSKTGSKIGAKFLLRNLNSKVAFSTLALSLVAALGACSSTPKSSDDADVTDAASLDTTPSTDSDAQNSSSADASAQNPAPSGGDQAATDDAINGADGSSGDVAASGSTSSGDGSSGGHVHAYRGSKAPEVAHSPFQSDGRWLNGVYFVRSPQENWESISNLIYGRPDRADMIANWNHQGTMEVGRAVYYNSPTRPDDSTSMKSIADDFGFAMEKVEVKAGDSLSLIGQGRYGDPQTWREIAALNPEIKNPDRIEVGQTLAIQPTQMDTKSVLDKLVAQAAQPPPAPDAKPADQVAESAPAQAPPAVVAPPEAPVPTPEAPQATLSKSPTVSTGTKSSDFLLKIGAVFAAGALILLFIRRRNAKRNSWDETQANVSKLTRTGL